MDFPKSKKNSRPDTHTDPDDTKDYSSNQARCRATGPQSRASSDSQPRPSASIPKATLMAVPEAFPLQPNQLLLLRTASHVPPVTKRTLSELDLEQIMRNIHLRTDANFDRDLHFQPDLDGERGQRKRRFANEYYEALRLEISMIAESNQQGIEVRYGSAATLNDRDGRLWFSPRLPGMFETLQDILKALVPERDHISVSQNLDITLLMQQVSKGVLDLIALSTWLAALLKSHCAPMRDELADEMVRLIEAGYQNQDMAEVVRGLQALFHILEAMKLDVANHQIRAFRMILIEETIPFLQGYFNHAMNEDRITVADSLSWYRSVQSKFLNTESQEPAAVKNQPGFNPLRPMMTMFSGLCDLLLCSDVPAEFPSTFLFDVGRLRQLRAEIQRLINEEVCWDILMDHVNDHRWSQYHRDRLRTKFHARIWPLLDDNRIASSAHNCRVPNVEHLAVEIARTVCSITTGQDKDIPDSVLHVIEKEVERSLAEESPQVQQIRTEIREKLWVLTADFAKRYLRMSPLAICESQRSSHLPPFASVYSSALRLESLAMRFAHIGVLHWRVWAPLLYERERTFLQQPV